jgi:hypothetical protein
MLKRFQELMAVTNNVRSANSAGYHFVELKIASSIHFLDRNPITPINLPVFPSSAR